MVASVGHDAARLTLVALTQAGADHPKACRRMRRAVVDFLYSTPALPAVRDEAIRSVQRACGACRACKGV